MPSFEDKVLQRAVAMVLEAVYEQDFLDCSYGFRPRRSAHQALDALWRQVMQLGGGWVITIDMQTYFDIHQLLVVKITRQGKPMLRVETISETLAAKLADNPTLLRTPDKLWTLLDAQGQVAETPPSLQQTPEASTMIEPPNQPIQPPPGSRV